MTDVTGVTGGTPDAEETNLAEPIRPSLSVELSMEPDDPDQELRVRYVNRELRNPRPTDPDYWDQVIDLR